MQSSEAQTLTAELQSGETLVWSGQPTSRAQVVSPATRGPLITMGVVFFGFGVILTLGAVGTLLPDVADILSSGNFSENVSILSTSLLLVLVLVLFTFGAPIGVIYALRRQAQQQRTSLYGITNRRVIIMNMGKTKTLRSVTFGPATTLMRTENADGSGNLSWSLYGAATTATAQANALFGIPNVREAERHLQALIQASGKSSSN